MPVDKISIVTVVKDNAQFIERCLQSVLQQNLDIELEYIIFDAVSSDGTSEIIQKYAKDDCRIKYFRERDDGPSDALRKGFSLATGEILCWINSDDYYLDGTLQTVVDLFKADSRTNFVFGDYFTKSQASLTYKPKFPFNKNVLFYRYMMMPQPSSFWSKDIYIASGGLDPEFSYSFDYDLFLRMGHLPEFRAKYIPSALSVFEIHSAQITAQGDAGFKRERHIARRKIREENRVIYRIRKLMATAMMYALYFKSNILKRR